MINVKAFMGIKSMITNVPTKVDPLGELPMYCVTYTKEVGMYNIVNKYPDVKLYTLYAKDSNGTDVELDNTIQNEIFEIYSKIYDYCNTHIKPLKKTELIAYLRAELVLLANNIAIGKFVSNDTDELPSWVSWDSINYNYRIKLYLSGEVLLYDYDEYEITVIPPIDDLNKFFQGPTVVESELNKKSIQDLMDEAQLAKEQHPETVTRVLNYTYKDPNTGISYNTNWVVLIYGIAGDNTEAIKDAINDYCLENSDYDRAKWKEIFTELFSRTEIILLPRYDLYSIPTLYTQEGIHKSMLNLEECINYALSNISYYDSEHIRNNVTIFPHDYKCIMVLAVPGDTNIEGARSIQEIYPDYIPVSSTSTDFMRMKEATREFCLKLESMLRICGDLDENTDIPQGYRRVRRDNQLYISVTINKVYYLMKGYKA